VACIIQSFKRATFVDKRDALCFIAKRILRLRPTSLKWRPCTRNGPLSESLNSARDGGRRIRRQSATLRLVPPGAMGGNTAGLRQCAPVPVNVRSGLTTSKIRRSKLCTTFAVKMLERSTQRG
jgi:hypothetical protein